MQQPGSPRDHGKTPDYPKPRQRKLKDVAKPDGLEPCRPARRRLPQQAFKQGIRT
jgi:hypothetical protein|tara:strand:+ start:745 stop:909 length:165 start_codon:yes stop_codon:yes gene_type:complete